MPFTTKRYIADLHFGHAAIIQSCARPFASAEEMDEHMISRWNSVAKDDDITFILGDFAANLADSARVREVFGRLAGRKRLILGNHDIRRGDQIHPTLAGLAWDAQPAHAAETTDNKVRIYMSHYAHRVWPGAHYGSVHFYGHSHGKCPPLGRSRDVGVDMPDVTFTPRTFGELTEARRPAMEFETEESKTWNA